MLFFSATCNSTARLDGKTVVITGANTGIGKETAKDLYRRGARVILACRNMEKALAAVQQIETECTGGRTGDSAGQLSAVQLDLASLQSVRACADHLLSAEDRLDVLVNNAGVMMCPHERTADDFEMQFGTNHLGHFLFTILLLPLLANSPPARIVNVSSLGHKHGTIGFDDLNFKTRPYGAIKAYTQSKLANILFTKELAFKLEENKIKGITVYALHPGVIQTELGRHLDRTVFPGARWLFRTVGCLFVKSPVQGAQTSIYCAVDEAAGQETGHYYAECARATCSPAAQDRVVAARLWTESVQLVGLTKDPVAALAVALRRK